MPQMRKCQNSKCGQYFEYNPARKQLYCCSKCRQEANNRKRNRKRSYHKHQPELKSDPNRPYTRDTVYLIHKWHREGMTAQEIAELLNRSVENVQAALESPITHSQVESMKRYSAPVKTSHRGTQDKN